MKTHTVHSQSRRRQLAWLVVVIAVAAWWTQMPQLAEARRQREDFPDVNVERNLVYKQVDGRSLRLDIYTPKSIAHSLPVALWIHGGGWSRGSKEQRPPVNLMAHGYANCQHRIPLI